MKLLNGILVFSAVIVGINCIELNHLGATIKDEITEEISDLTAPIIQLKNDMVDLAVLAKTKLSNFEFTNVGQILATLGSSSACTNLTNHGELARLTFAKTEHFAMVAFEKLYAEIEDLINCSKEPFVNQWQCAIEKFKIVHHDMALIQKSFPEYKDLLAQTYKTILSDLKNCINDKF